LIEIGSCSGTSGIFTKTVKNKSAQKIKKNPKHHNSRMEFGKIMNDLQEKTTVEFETALFESCDTDKSGTVDFKEFCALMVRYIKGDGTHFQGVAVHRDVGEGGLFRGRGRAQGCW
jgi:hypothetical protein